MRQLRFLLKYNKGRGLLQEPEGDALAVKIHGKHCDHYLLMEFQHLGRVIHTTARKAHLGDVYEAVLLDAYVHESSEGCDKFRRGGSLWNRLYAFFL